MSVLRLMVAALAIGCGSESETVTSIDSGPDTGAVKDTATAPLALGKILVKVTYSGTRKGSLAIGAFTEPEPKSKPPVAFDTSKAPAFPYPGELRGLEPGKYWVVALLDLEPVSGAAVKPGPEDVQAISMPVEIKGSDEQSVEITLAD